MSKWTQEQRKIARKAIKTQEVKCTNELADHDEFSAFSENQVSECDRLADMRTTYRSGKMSPKQWGKRFNIVDLIIGVGLVLGALYLWGQLLT